MREQALASPHAEICGLIGGSGNRALSLYPVANFADMPECNFLMEPREQIAAMRAMRNENEAFWGIYHSHPLTSADPSPTDRELAAYPDLYYFIISLQSNTIVLGSYYFNGDDFIPVETVFSN